MRKFAISISIQAIAATGILSISAMIGTPALAQQEAVGETISEVVETVTDGEEAENTDTEPPIEAITAKDSTIATDQLELLLKPLALDNMTAEADA
ncbi:MAG: small-conductance mechanosensitive channel, partial [Phormidesmis sp.]